MEIKTNNENESRNVVTKEMPNISQIALFLKTQKIIKKSSELHFMVEQKSAHFNFYKRYHKNAIQPEKKEDEWRKVAKKRGWIFSIIFFLDESTFTTNCVTTGNIFDCVINKSLMYHFQHKGLYQCMSSLWASEFSRQHNHSFQMMQNC